MKILVVAMSNSIHTARWLSQIAEEGWEIYLFPSIDIGSVHDSISNNITILTPFYFIVRRLNKKRVFSVFYVLYRFIHMKINSHYLEKRLYKYINKITPDLVHTMETQAAGYLVSNVKNKYYVNRKFPLWWHTNWGSDIYLFGRLKFHIPKIKKVLKECNFYSCECLRDVQLAIKFGFKGKVLPVYPNTGGFNIAQITELRKKSRATSVRKNIMLKGYQGFAGRALVGLRALARAKDVLSGYKIIIYSNTDADDIKIAAELFSQDTGIEVCLVPQNSPHEDILKFQSSARISIGVSISDSISTSLLEAMAMGSFPIQSWTSAADEWIKDGETGLLVPPEDPEEIEKAIRIALSDDGLVDNANEHNWNTIHKNLNLDNLKVKTINSYQEVLNGF